MDHHPFHSETVDRHVAGGQVQTLQVGVPHGQHEHRVVEEDLQDERHKETKVPLVQTGEGP